MADAVARHAARMGQVATLPTSPAHRNHALLLLIELAKVGCEITRQKEGTKPYRGQ
jgi:hypothetical protein